MDVVSAEKTERIPRQAADPLGPSEVDKIGIRRNFFVIDNKFFTGPIEYGVGLYMSKRKRMIG